MTRIIRFATEEQEIEDCYPVMAELRPHVAADEFLQRIRRQQQLAGFQLAYLADGEGKAARKAEVKAVAGIRVSECLAFGKYLYVDDLATKAGERSKGYGGALFDWLVEYARAEGCDYFTLDSGVQRFAAHRFYLTKRLIIQAHHFVMPLARE